MKIETQDLTGPALDYAVARAMGKRPSMFIVQQTGELAKEHRYSTDWSQGGPIIDRMMRDGLRLSGYTCRDSSDPTSCQAQIKSVVEGGPSALVAAMRCYVAIKLGDAVEIPDELMEALNGD